jgi:hypothetical protein
MTHLLEFYESFLVDIVRGWYQPVCHMLTNSLPCLTEELFCTPYSDIITT